MTSLMIVSIYFLFKEKTIKSYLFLVLSVGIKFATGFLFPAFLFRKFIKPYFFEVAIILLLISVVAQALRANFQSWYILTALPLIGFTRLQRPYILTSIISFGGLLYYLPVIRYGDWNRPVPQQLLTILIFTIILALGYILFELREYMGIKKRSV